MRTASILLAFALCVAVGCSSGGSDAPRAGEAAGKVIQVVGAVKAERAGNTRDLTMGAEVFGEDVITTLPGASVSIELFHNNARWTISPGKTRKVNESVAWRAAKQTRAALARNETDRSTAAGRSAERSSANTAATAMAPGAPPAAAPPAAPAAEREQSAPKPKPARKRRSKRASTAEIRAEVSRRVNILGGGQKGGSAGKLKRKSKPAPAKGAKAKDLGSLLQRNRFVEEDNDRARPAPAPAPAPSSSRPGGAARAPERSRAPGKGAAPTVTGTVTIGRTSVTPGLSKEVVRRILRARSGAMRSCYDRALRSNSALRGTLTLTIHIAATGRVTRARVSGASKSLASTSLTSCLISRAKAIKFPAPLSGKTPVAGVVLTFQPRK